MFEFSHDLVSGDHIYVHIPKLTNGSDETLDLGGDNGGSFAGFWDREASTVVLTALGSVVASSSIEVIVLEQSGLLLPKFGIDEGEPFNMSTDAVSIVTGKQSVVSKLVYLTRRVYSAGGR